MTDYDYAGASVDRPAMVEDLERLDDGDVRFRRVLPAVLRDGGQRRQVTPIGVFPTSTEDVSGVVSYCAEREITVLPRGGAISLAGQTVNEAVVLDFTRSMDGLLDVDPGARRAPSGTTRRDRTRWCTACASTSTSTTSTSHSTCPTNT